MDQPTQSKGKLPSHRIYCVTGEGEQAQWTPIGAAWPTRNGGFTQSLIAIPLQGRIVMQPITERMGEGGQQ